MPQFWNRLFCLSLCHPDKKAGGTLAGFCMLLLPEPPSMMQMESFKATAFRVLKWHCGLRWRSHANKEGRAASDERRTK